VTTRPDAVILPGSAASSTPRCPPGGRRTNAHVRTDTPPAAGAVTSGDDYTRTDSLTRAGRRVRRVSHWLGVRQDREEIILQLLTLPRTLVPDLEKCRSAQRSR
jgi:hypothetical protein